MRNPNYPASDIETGTNLLIDTSDKLYNIINKPASESIVVDEGDPIPSIRKALANSFFFNDVQDWKEGELQTDWSVPRRYSPLNETSTFWWCPSASSSSPVPMGNTPIGDSRWQSWLASDVVQQVEGVLVDVTTIKGEVESLSQTTSGYVSQAEGFAQDSKDSAGLSQAQVTLAKEQADLSSSFAVQSDASYKLSSKSASASLTYANRAEAQADEAATYVGDCQAQVTLAETEADNSAKSASLAAKYAQDALNVANQIFKSGGYFKPTQEVPYPNTTGVDYDIVYIINFEERGDSFIFPNGQLAGKTTIAGDLLLWISGGNSFELVTSGAEGAAVFSVNGHTGAVVLNHGDVGALPTGTTAADIGGITLASGDARYIQQTVQPTFATKTDISSLASIEALGDVEDKVDTNTTLIGSKASQASLDSLTDVVGTKASESSVQTLSGRVDTLNSEVAKNTTDIQSKIDIPTPSSTPFQDYTWFITSDSLSATIPADYTFIRIQDRDGICGTLNATLTPPEGQTIMNSPTFTVDVNYFGCSFVLDGTNWLYLR